VVTSAARGDLRLLPRAAHHPTLVRT
jgi:hypothetical protein